MMKKFAGTVAVVVAMALSLVACGGGSGSDAAAPSTAAAAGGGSAATADSGGGQADGAAAVNVFCDKIDELVVAIESGDEAAISAGEQAVAAVRGPATRATLTDPALAEQMGRCVQKRGIAEERARR
jgi:hypothetical protein